MTLITQKYNPKNLSEFKGHIQAVGITRANLLSPDPYRCMFISGPYGVGKTTLAKIIARALNCLSLDSSGDSCGQCRECLSFDKGVTFGGRLQYHTCYGLDASGVRSIISGSSNSPHARFRVFILDEFHALSEVLQGMLLSTLCDPPRKAVFILCTDQKNKVIPTIFSRCLKIHLGPFDIPECALHLSEILRQEGAVELSEDVDRLYEISLQSNGHLRDAIIAAKSASDMSKINNKG